MSTRWLAVSLAVLLLVSMPGAVVGANVSAAPQTNGTQAASPSNSPVPHTPQPTSHATTFEVTPQADGEPIPWRTNRLPAFVGDSVSLQIEPTDGYAFVNATWETTGPVAIDIKPPDTGTATVMFNEAGETSLTVTATLRNVDTNTTIERTSPQYTLISTPTDQDTDRFSVTYAESPDRWTEAAVSAHLRDLPMLHANLSQRLPLPEPVDLVYTTRDEIQHECSSYAYACVEVSGGESTMYMPYDAGNYTLAQRASVYRHELTHVAQFDRMDMTSNRDWAFIVEGHAEYEESPRFIQPELEEKPSQRELLDFTGGDYGEAELFVSAFIAAYDYESLEEIIALSEYYSIDQAFQRVVDESFTSFYDRWAPTNASAGPNAVRAQFPSSPDGDQIHQKPRFVYRGYTLTARGFGPYASGEGVTVSWDTDANGSAELTGQTANWTPAETGEHTVTVTYTNGNASLSRTQTITVSEVPLTPQDLDDDGLYEDVNSDGQVTISDVQALFTNRDDPAVQRNPDRFDFNGDGQFTIVDVQSLFQEVS